MPLPVEQRVRSESLALVVFGATGDLATKKLFPAVFSLHHQGFLPPMTLIVGYGRSAYTTDTFREFLREALAPRDASQPPLSPLSPTSPPKLKVKLPSSRSPYTGTPRSSMHDALPRTCSEMSSLVGDLQPSAELLEAFLLSVVYVRSMHNYGGLEAEAPANAMSSLTEVLNAHRDAHPSATAHNRAFYLALPHEVWPHICNVLKQRCMSETGWNRLVLEKPFGRDASSAIALNTSLLKLFTEEQVYRMDRYLGKEIIENLLVMRFANRFLSPIWNRDNIKTVQIIFKENFGADDQNRTQYFDNQGILRDVVQNHLLQVMALIAMEKPASLSHEDIRDEKLKVLRCIQEIRLQDIVVGQYTASKGHRGYLEHPSVSDDSRTPTFCMAVLRIRNERWDGVPFILKAGKGLNERRSEIRIQLREVPGDLFADQTGQGPNEFVLRMQPEEELYLKMTIKKPGLGMNIVPSEMQLSEQWKMIQLQKNIEGIAPRRAFERLLMDLIHGQQAHFVRNDELIAAWRILTPILEKISCGEVPLHHYAFGSRGPAAAELLRAGTGHTPNIVPKDGVPLSSSSDDIPGLLDKLQQLMV